MVVGRQRNLLPLYFVIVTVLKGRERHGDFKGRESARPHRLEQCSHCGMHKMSGEQQQDCPSALSLQQLE